MALADDRAPKNLYFWEAARLAEAKSLLAQASANSVDDTLREAVHRVRKEADAGLRRGPYSVTDNDNAPPSGDSHDYVSYSVYWWPDPAKADGLPYIRRDGRTNEVQKAKGDRNALSTMVEDVEALSLGYYLFERQAYADQALRLLRTWFLDPDTRMNPHLEYAQAVLGRETGRNGGIIDARQFIELLDAIALLENTGAIPEADQRALQDWFSSYLTWLLNSQHGQQERQAGNNHGTWYAAQAVRVALFVGDESTAKKLLTESQQRLADAVDAGGRQEEELKRTRSLHYSLFQLAAFIHLARFGEAQGIDLWHNDSQGRSSIERALDYVAPYVIDQKHWPHEEIGDYKVSPQIAQVLRMAHQRYGRRMYAEVLGKAPRSQRSRDWSALVVAPRKSDEADSEP